jgi:dihydroorotate dehydrogenase (fumarate)
MTNISTTYMGLPISSPIVVGACSLSKRVDNIQHLEDSGAGALVVKSLFEEQIQIENRLFEEQLAQYDNAFSEAISMFPRVEPGGAKEHLYWLEKTRKATKMPIFASLNCVNRNTWVEYAKKLAETGVDGLELNFYSPAMQDNIMSSEIEASEAEIFSAVHASVKIPISVKLHPYYTSLPHVIASLDRAGAKSVVLFNRLFQPDIDIEKERRHGTIALSNPHDALIALRWTALLHDRINADIIASGGIGGGHDAVKMLLAGAKAVQVVSTLYRHSASHISKMNEEIAAWMSSHGYKNIEEFRGKVGKRHADDAWSFERGQYIKAIVGFD